MRYKLDDFYPKETFYRVPKVIIKDSRYKGLSVNAILAYAIYQDRFELSLKNNWIDKENNVYFYYKIEKMQEKLNLSKNTVIRIKNELRAFNLIEEVRQGMNKPNRIYLLKPETADNKGSSYLGHSKYELPDVPNMNPNDTEYSDTKKIKDTNKDTSKEMESFLLKDFSDYFNVSLVSKKSIQLLQNFGDLTLVKEMIDIVYSSKRKVENYYSKENNKKYKIYGDIWTDEIDKQVKKLIFKMKEYQMKDKPIKKITDYWFKTMQNFWENVLLMELYEGMTKLDFLNNTGDLKLKDYILDFNDALKEFPESEQRKLRYEWIYKVR